MIRLEKSCRFQFGVEGPHKALPRVSQYLLDTTKDIALGLRKMWSLPASFDIALPTQHRAGSIYQLIGIRDRETASLSLKSCRKCPFAPFVRVSGENLDVFACEKVCRDK